MQVMLRWASKSRCVQECAGFIFEPRPSSSFVSRFASKASEHNTSTGTRVKLSALNASRNHGNASVPESKLCRQSAGDTSGDAKISVHDVGRLGVDVNFCTGDVKALACHHRNATSHFAGNVKDFRSATCMPRAKTRFSNGDARGAESVASSWETQALHVLLQILFEQAAVKKAQKGLADLQQKIELLESEQFSLSDARRLLQKRPFKSCSAEQLATVLQELRRFFPCAEVVHGIVVRSSTVLLQPAELVQQKLKLLQDFQVEEKVISKLCSRGGVLSASMESLRKKLMFFDDLGLTVKARNIIFSTVPLILILTLENCIQGHLKLLESIGLTKERILEFVQYCPDIFYMSLNSLMKKYEYIRQLGFSVDKIPRAFLYARRLSIKAIADHLQTLRDLGFTDCDVRFMLHRQPAILSLSSKNLKCTVDFLICKQHRNLAEIVLFPTCLMFSVQARMIPRFNVINELGHSEVYRLSHILRPTDSVFVERFGKAIDFEESLAHSAENSSHENLKN